MWGRVNMIKPHFFFRKTSHNIFFLNLLVGDKHKSFKAQVIHYRADMRELVLGPLISNGVLCFLGSWSSDNVYVFLSLPWKCLTSNSLLSYS